jgi:hypothetical protein
MKNLVKVSSLVLLFMFSIMASSGTFASGFSYADDEPNDGDMLAEWLVRPVAALGTAMGAVTFVVGLPFSILADNTEESFDMLVVEPFEYTVHRPMGHYSNSRE